MLQNFEKLKRDPLESLKKFRKKNFKSHSAQKSEKKRSFGIFQHQFCCKISNKLKGGPFGDIKKFSKSLTKSKR